MGSSTPPSPSTTPTTFFQADIKTFRDLVQKLTGISSEESQELTRNPTSQRPTTLSQKKPQRPQFKLQDRRQHSMRKLEIQLGLNSLCNSPRQLSASPVSPFGSDMFSGCSGSQSPLSEEQEEKVIAEKGFYLYPSPASTPRGSDPPELLPLFPLAGLNIHGRVVQLVPLCFRSDLTLHDLLSII
ncbi:VQ protein [Dillenia turbinata]|uniref:VQ protein n=1 Tax=Dillenia turbinata TaxID=194707 RepID=A0AAN8Z7D7_9MAGN